MLSVPMKHCISPIIHFTCQRHTSHHLYILTLALSYNNFYDFLPDIYRTNEKKEVRATISHLVDAAYAFINMLA